MLVPFVDLQLQYAGLRSEVLSAVADVFESGQFVLGQQVAAFEDEFAEYCGVRHGVAVNSGTSALHLALIAAGVRPGDEVITVPYTFVATVAAILYAGAKPVFVDVDPATWTIDACRIEAAITRRTKAVLLVHLYGSPADMDPILSIARQHGLAVIEDAAQAHGAVYKGRRCGSIGHIGCFSFYPGKNLGAYGEGGFVATNDSDVARTIRMLRDWGAEKKYEHVLKGFNYRMEAVQGAVLRIKLRRLETWTEARRSHARSYRNALAGVPITMQAEIPNTRHVYHIVAVLTDRRRDVSQYLTSKGIQTGIHYPTPVHLLPAYADLGHRAGDFPASEHIASHELSLPMYPEMTTGQVQYVAEAMHEFYSVEQGTPLPSSSASAAD